MSTKSLYALPLLLGGCALAPADDEATGTSVDELRGVDASYVVPVADETLRASASYPVRGAARWKVDDGVARLRYELPRALVGTSARVDMVGVVDASTGAFELTGPAGTASCTEESGLLTCAEHLPGVRVDLTRVTREVSPLADAASRVAVSESFARDPIGIFTMRLRRP